MGKYEADAEDSDARSLKGEDSKVERRHSKHHHHRRSRSHDRSRDKEDRDSMRGELSDSPSHKHRHHHHHHHHSKDEKDEERSKRRHTTSMKHKKSSTDTEDSRHRHHRHSRKNSTSSEKSYGMPTIVGSRLAPTLSDLSIRGSSRRNSRSVALDEPSYKLTEEPKQSLDTIVVVDDTPKAEIPKVTVVEERTVVVERVVVTEPESIIVDEVVVVVDSTPTPQLVVPQESAPIATIVTTIPSSAATTSSMSAPSSPMPAALAQQPVQQTVIYQQPAPSPSVPSASIVNRRSISDRSDSFTPDAGNPGRLPSPLPSSLRDTKRFSSLIEPPIPWESKKDKKKAKRARKKSEHKKNILGETIYKGHPSWLLMRDIQTGLFQSIKTVSTNATKSAINLFHTPSVQVFPIAPGSTSTFKFKDYCPGAFYKLREHFGINHQDYVASICHNWNEVGTPGKSGSLFFFSQDNQYVLKTIPKREAKLLRTLLPSYYHHMVKNDNSLLTRFMGLHRVKPHKGRQVRFLVMGNLFSGPLKIHQRFDLKGSTVGRELSAEARQKKNPTFKDMDFRRLNKKIPLGPNVRENFLRQLEEDCKFLVSQNIMDYSLLIGIHFKSEEEHDSDYSSQDEPESPMSRSTTNLPAFEVPEDSGHFPRRFESVFEKEEGGLRGRAEDGTELDEFYYIGIIDILMLYTMRKQIEHAYKKVTSRGGEISSVAPDEYAHRFIKFISDIVA